MVNVLRINPADSVVMAMTDLPAGTRLDLGDGQGELAIQTREPIPFGHKIAVVSLKRGEHIIKYGASIGVATQDIAPGQHVHSHNLATVRGAARS
jgi:hypothetical protein